ncbi:hypothetical protein DSECCO2_310530 [anaerobic digester metagenome]
MTPMELPPRKTGPTPLRCPSSIRSMMRRASSRLSGVSPRPPGMSRTDAALPVSMTSSMSCGTPSAATATTKRSTGSARAARLGTQDTPSTSAAEGWITVTFSAGKPWARTFCRMTRPKFRREVDTPMIPMRDGWSRASMRSTGRGALKDDGRSEKRHMPSRGTIMKSWKAKGLISSSSMTKGASALVGEKKFPTWMKAEKHSMSCSSATTRFCPRAFPVRTL